jgi:hypothetical protein
MSHLRMYEPLSTLRPTARAEKPRNKKTQGKIYERRRRSKDEDHLNRTLNATRPTGTFPRSYFGAAKTNLSEDVAPLAAMRSYARSY